MTKTTTVGGAGMDSRSIVRTKYAGVHFGQILTLDLAAGTAIMTNVRRLWYWNGAASLSELAVKGPGKPATCKFPVPVHSVQLTEVIEVLDVTIEAAAKIDAVPEWTAQ